MDQRSTQNDFAAEIFIYFAYKTFEVIKLAFIHSFGHNDNRQKDYRF